MKKVVLRILLGLLAIVLVVAGVVGVLYLSGRNKMRSEVLAGSDFSSIGGFDDPLPTQLPVVTVDENGEIVIPETTVTPTPDGEPAQTGEEPAPTEAPAETPADADVPSAITPAEVAVSTDDEDGVVTYKGQRYRYNDDLINILVMGIDKNSVVTQAQHGTDGGQADAIFLLMLDGSTGTINIVTVNRNSMVPVDIYTRSGKYYGQGVMQITLQHSYGDGMAISNERMAETVSRMFHNIPIHAYASINMGGIATLNDAIGGVSLTPMMDIPGTSIKQGQPITLMGRDAYDYVHWRDYKNEFASADKRLERQKQYLDVFGRKALAEMKQNPGIVADLYNIMKQYMVTDLTLDRVTYLAAEAGGYKFNSSNIYSVPGTTRMGTLYEEYYVDEEGLRELIIKLFFKQI
ncbi:MAG: LCP family protein [Lachnospiraceae bacterium]|nr:LCP family protein [Lachnospiraceae bacterium]